MGLKTKKMMEIRVNQKTELIDDGIEMMFERKVSSFGTGAKIDCPKEHLGKDVYVIVKKRKTD